MNAACSACGSSDVRSLRAVYESGTALKNARMSGVGLAGGGVGGGVASSRGSSITLEAARAAPPTVKANVGPGCAVVVIALILGAAVHPLFYAGAVIAIVMWNRASNAARVQKLAAYEIWARSFHCARCGSITQPAEMVRNVTPQSAIEERARVTVPGKLSRYSVRRSRAHRSDL